MRNKNMNNRIYTASVQDSQTLLHPTQFRTTGKGQAKTTGLLSLQTQQYDRCLLLYIFKSPRFEDRALLAKLLYELIEPAEQRIAAVLDFLREIDDSLEYKVVPITDPFGPSTVDKNLDAIVASAETERGARKVCDKRIEKVIIQKWLTFPVFGGSNILQLLITHGYFFDLRRKLSC